MFPFVTLWLLSHRPVACTLPIGTWTPYDLVRGDISTAPLAEDLEPVAVYLIARRGTGHFGEQVAAGMQRMAGEVAAEGVIPWLSGWQVPTYYPDENLIPLGMLEHYQLAQRFKARFPELFPSYYPRTYDARSTSTDPASQSASSFLFGLFQGAGPVTALSTVDNISWTGFQPYAIREDDATLDFLSDCPEYGSQHEMYEDSISNYRQRAEYRVRILDPLSNELKRDVSDADVLDLYMLCTLEITSPEEAKNSHFCDLFTEHMFEIITHMTGQQDYFALSYGNPIAPKLSCLLLQDIVDSLKTRPDQVHLRFTDSSSILPLITLINLYSDSPEVWLNHEMGFLNLSRVDSFSSNLAFVTFRKRSTGEEVLKIYANEQETRLPGCGACDDSFCSCTLDYLESLLASADCDREELCSASWDEEAEEKAALMKFLNDENAVALDIKVFVIMLIICGTALILFIVVCCNIKKLMDNEVHHRDFWDVTPFSMEHEKMLP